jgi:putative SOS response-associated peptidase YedK
MTHQWAETLATSGVFRSSVSKYRCIIPADGFYEWRMIDLDKKTKQPMYMRLRDKEMIGFAGLYTLPSPENPATTATIITITPRIIFR